MDETLNGWMKCQHQFTPPCTSIYLFNQQIYTELGKSIPDKGDSESKGPEMGISWISSKTQEKGQGGWGRRGEKWSEMTTVAYAGPRSLVADCVFSKCGGNESLDICKNVSSHWSLCRELVTRRQG